MTDTMAESRRVEFQTIAAPEEEKKAKKRQLIPRFSLALGESTASTCPEFSFTELVKKEKVESEPVVNDAFGDEEDCHDEVAALAKKFEEKYGPKPSGKKRKLKCLEDDYYDMGDGYDENDPFIDNTEAYDEVVPSCLTTKHGGFYINRGTLDFRTLSDQEDSDGDFTTPIVKKRGRPRKIMDSDNELEDGEEVKKKKFKKKVKEGVEGEKKKKRKLTFGPDGEKIIKRRKVLDPEKKKKTSSTVKELLKQQTASTANAGAINGSAEDHTPPSPRPSPPHDTDNQADGEEKRVADSDKQLPSDLPAELEAAIVDIKQAAKDSKEGKCKFFSNHVNKLLLGIELASRQLAPGKRPIIYAHLAEHLPCGKETLIKRAKKLRENQQDDQLKVPIQRLKEEIDKVMPALQEQHDREVVKARQENREKQQGGELPKEEGVNTESDEEDKNAMSGVTTEGQSRKGNRDPRKKFKWTQEIKTLLCQIVTIKMHMFDTYKFRNQTAEEYLKTFLENEIKPLWPQGWIQTRMLFKETRSVHGSWTNPAKPKRPALMSRSAASPTLNHMANTSATENHNSPTRPPSRAAASGDPEVIEVSDIDEPAPVPSKDRGRATASVPDEVSRSMTGDGLKFSPNSVEAMAAATAAAVAAAVSVPKSEPPPSLGERRPHLMSEMLKKPGGTDPGTSFSRPIPKTPPVSDAGVSPFMAEFSRYLSNSNSQPTSSSSSRQGPSPSQPNPSQLQSKTISSSTGRPDDRKASHLTTMEWKMKMEDMVAVDKGRKLTQESLPPARPPNAHSGHQGATPMDSAQQERYKMMAAVLMGELGKADMVPSKTKGEAVRDKILAKIQAEMEADKNSRTGPSAGRPSGEVGGKRTAGASQTATRPSGPPVSATSSQQRQAPPPAHTSRQSLTHSIPPSTPKQPGLGNASVSRQPPPSHPPPTSKQAGIVSGMAPRQPLRPSIPSSNPKQPPGMNATSVPRPSPTGSRPSPGARQSPMAGASGARQSPTPVARQSPNSLARQSPATSLAGQLPVTASRQPATAAAGKQAAMASPRPTVAVAHGGQSAGNSGKSLMPPYQSSQQIPSSTLPPQRNPTSLPPSSSQTSVCVRPVSLPAQRKPSLASTPTTSGTAPGTGSPARPPQRPITSQPPGRVMAGQGQGMKASPGQGQMMKVSGGQVISQSRVSAGHSLLQRSSATSLLSNQRNPSQSPDAGRKVSPVPQSSQNLPGGTPPGVTSRGQGASSSLGLPKGQVRSSSTIGVEMQNRQSPVQRLVVDKAAISPGSQVGNQGSKLAGSIPHSRPSPQNTPRLQQPAAAAAGKAGCSKPSPAHSGTSVTPAHSQASGLNPQAVDPPKPPPGYGQ